MTAYSITTTVEDHAVQAMLTRLDTTLEPAAIAGFLTGAVVPYLQKRGKMRFESEGDDVSGKWLPLTEGTQSIRSAQGYGGAHPINKRDGELEEYIVGSPGMPVVEMGVGASLTYPGRPPGNGNLQEKFQTAQQGQKSRQDGMRPAPARPVLGVNEADMGNIVLMLTYFIHTGDAR